jgi:predicted aspartyl protease
MLTALAVLGGIANSGVQSAPIADHLPARSSAQTSAAIAYTTDETLAGGSAAPLVQVTLNDRTQATFLLDTGTSDCCVTDVMAARLGLTPSLTGKAAAPFLMEGRQARSVPLTLQVGCFRFSHYTTLVIKASRFPQVLGHPLDGILGMNLLRRFALILEPQSHRLVLTKPGRLTTEQRQGWGFHGASCLPLTRTDNGLYEVSVGLGNGDRNARADLSIDTGAGTSVLSYTVARSLSLTPIRQGLTIPFGSGAFHGDLAAVPVLSLGRSMDTTSAGLVGRDGIFLYSSRPESSRTSPHVLGMNILSGYSVLLDFPGATLYLQPPSTAMTEPVSARG